VLLTADLAHRASHQLGLSLGLAVAVRLDFLERQIEAKLENNWRHMHKQASHTINLSKVSHRIFEMEKGLHDLRYELNSEAGLLDAPDLLWEYALEDALDLVARIPVVAAMIYRRTFADGKVPAYDSKLDWAGNYAQMLGVSSDEKFKEVTRLYLMLHADHEGGNVSAHTTHLVGSALSDPYYSWAAGLCGLAGPLHGLANQECLGWLLEVQKDLKGQTPTKELLTEYAENTLKSGKVIPGFGHAVLRNTDPRYMLEREFALKNTPDDPLFKLVDACYQAIPPVLEKTGKVKNPYPNVDAHSGQLMYFYGMKEQNYYTVVFAVSRALGCMAQVVWSRAIGLPIERPKSVPLDTLATLAAKAAK